jgi:MFS family permease
MVSGALCLLYPWMNGLPPELLMALLLVWGVAVVADSPQFSALAASTAPKETVGSSLAVMNAVGFGLTLPAIWLTSGFLSVWDVWVALLLLPGPVFGLWSLNQGKPEA